MQSSTETPTPSTQGQLNMLVMSEVSRGWAVESQNAEMAILTKGKRPNHILHLLLTIFTAGLWLPVWIVLACVMGEKRKTIAVSA